MRKFLKLFLLSILIGISSGALSSAFLHSLNSVTSFRMGNDYLIWLLPLFGLLLGLVIKLIPHNINQGIPYIVDESNKASCEVSPWMTPYIFVASIGTHLFGGSAGREGVGVIMGASISQLFSKDNELRPLLIYSGIAAGIASIFGTPLAAIFFAFELHHFKNAKSSKYVSCTIVSSYSAFFTSLILGPSRSIFNITFSWDRYVLMYLTIAVLTSGVGGHIFYWGLKGYTRLVSKLFPSILLKFFAGGLFISLLVFYTESYSYIGIGIDTIMRSFENQMTLHDFMMKCLLTIMTLSIGFKGGEATPLFFMGATFSNSIAGLLNLTNFGLSSALGMVGMFGAVTATPWASAVIGAELFGLEVGALCLVTCFLSRKLMGKYSVYRHL